MAVLSKNEVPPWGLAIAGSTGAIFANALVYPLDIVKTRLQVQVKHHHLESTVDPNSSHPRHYHGTIHAIMSILEDDGLSGLYQGMAGSLIGVASTNFAYFYWYSIVRGLYLSKVSKGQHPGTAAELSLGAVAGALAQLFTIPIAVVTTRQQTQSKDDKKGILETAKEVINGEDGVSGLWRGLKASLVLVVNPAITYGAYERLREVMYPNKAKLAAHEAFLLGALSKALATIATQPLIVAKVGLQSRPPPARNGRPFKSFIEVMRYIIEHEGILGLYKGVAPQILKGLLVQGILMMTKERVELMFILLFRYMRKLREEKLKQLAEIAAKKVEETRAKSAAVGRN
ncbi:hypothetical protein M433DRAFT_68103 [Acidomyces richmondensis BFW]|nr:MAG: hypothetical protein FE78DRAFT_32503 [Acidomyces sp. 'richmondensis']KYG45056.1 hypothetical protein M433DRAFT_68103 [Acidomyces richmondensis BFW]